MDGLNDPSLDREIESLLAAEPSPEFLARVRARVAKEPTPNRWRASWMLAVAGAVAVAVVIVALIAWPSRELAPAGPTGPALQVQRQPSLAGATETMAAPAPIQPIRRQPAKAWEVAVAASRDRAIDIDLPEVVIAENEVRTFASLVASVRQSRFDVAVPSAPDPDRPLEIKELPPVEPLEIEPIVRVAVLQTEGERP
jgi:hypothetical protein